MVCPRVNIHMERQRERGLRESKVHKPINKALWNTKLLRALLICLLHLAKVDGDGVSFVVKVSAAKNVQQSSQYVISLRLYQT